jgi:hypothetical protein
MPNINKTNIPSPAEYQEFIEELMETVKKGNISQFSLRDYQN